MKSLVLAGVLWSGIAAADTECRTVDVDLVPTAKLQIVAWIEDSGGHYVDTAFITQATGLRGIGNRVGLMDLHSGPLFPYGKRLDVAPIWAHRHGLTFPLVLCQGCDGIVDNESFDLDDEFSFAFANSSPELYFTRPLRPDEPAWDAGTAASRSTPTRARSATRSSASTRRAATSRARPPTRRRRRSIAR